MTIVDHARDIVYRHAYKALARGDLDAAEAMSHFARLLPRMQIASLKDAAQMARSWSECSEWADKRLYRKGLAPAVGTRKSRVATAALSWIAEALHSLADD